MLRTDAVVGAEQPGVEVAEDDVNHGQVAVCLFVVTTHCDAFVPVAQVIKVVVSDPSVRPHQRPRRHIRLDKWLKRFLLAAREALKSHSAGNEATAMAPAVTWLRGPLVRLFVISAWTLANFDNPAHENLVGHPAPFALGSATDKRLIHFYGPFLPDGISLRSHHRGSQLVEHLKCRFIAVDSEQLLKLDRTHPRRVRCRQPSRPEPKANGLLGPVQDRIGRKAGFVQAASASKDVGPGPDAIGLAAVAATRADKPLGKTKPEEVPEACLVVGEGSLEVRKRARSVHSASLHQASLWGNRIGMDCSFDKLRPLASNSDRKIISSCQHYNLLYQQRNFLVHEFREPGYGLGFNGHFAGPHYEHHLNADSSSRLELVYPVGFVFKCVLASLEKLRIHYQKEKIDPYSSYEFGSLWHHKSGNKN